MNLRVLHVLEAIEAGVARHVTDVVRHVRADHIVVTPAERVGGFTDSEAFGAMVRAGARVHEIPMRRSVTDPRNVVATARVRNLIHKHRPQVVHGHASIGGAAARLAAVGTAAARVYTPNGLMPSRLVRLVERGLGRITDRLVAVSPTEAALLRDLGIAAPERIVVIPNGIELEMPGPATINVRVDLGLSADAPLIGTVGRVAAQKAPEIFVRACALVAAHRPDANFVMIGDGPLSGAVAREVSKAGLADQFMHYRGIPHAATVIGQLDVFILLSRYEGGPYAPLEAMRAGTPVVLTDVIGNRDTVVDEESGLLVTPDDPAAAARAVLRVLQERGLSERLSQTGRERLAAHFDVRAMADRLTSVYESVAER